MERRKLTKEDIDKVRDIEGFPIGSDEDIIALSDAPYYTACPNPFIEEFIKEHGTPYDEETDDYHREPFTSDISEGKHDPFYMAHGYHTKVPFKAIKKYILHYTNPGDIVFDPFCGTGMTAVAAWQCGIDTNALFVDGASDIKYGKRHSIMSDLSPIASFIASNYSLPIDLNCFYNIIVPIVNDLKTKFSWMYDTKYEGHQATINYAVWSDIYVCNNCSNEFAYWDAAVCVGTNTTVSKPTCPHCGAEVKIKDINKAFEDCVDIYTGKLSKKVKQKLIMLKCQIEGKQYKKIPDEDDLSVIDKIYKTTNNSWVPTNDIKKGDKTSEPLKINIDQTHKIYSRRNLFILSKIYEKFNTISEKRYRNFAKFLFSSIYSRSHRMNRYMPDYNRHVGPLSGTLYFPYFSTEINIFNLIDDKINAMMALNSIAGSTMISTQSATCLMNIPSNSIDYIFTDPPFGDNIMYSELNLFNESWNKVISNNSEEAIINKTQKKSLNDYKRLMTNAFSEAYRVLKPGRWITVEFHNSKNTVWNAIQEALNVSGFIIADVRTLDKKKGTTNQMSYGFVVKQDLVISAYKPRNKFKKEFVSNSGHEETAWAFVRQHLQNIPVCVVKNGNLESISERKAFLLFDRMIAYHIMQGVQIPVDAETFYKGLDEKFLQRDGMYFLPSQVNEYDTARIKADVEPIQFTMFVTNEKSAIAWLYQYLDEKNNGPQTYADLQPKFMQEMKTVDKNEKMPELQTMLEENFLQDDKGRWYVPDITKEGDLAKLREKNLWREFEGYMNSTGKLKLFRSEAIRVGFSRLWKDKNYKAIVSIAERLPEKTIQEDQNLLMYYDISLGRV